MPTMSGWKLLITACLSSVPQTCMSVSRVHQGATLLLEVKHDNVHSGNYGSNRITNGRCFRTGLSVRRPSVSQADPTLASGFVTHSVNQSLDEGNLPQFNGHNSEEALSSSFF